MPRSYFVAACLTAAVFLASAEAASAQRFSLRSGAQAVQSLNAAVYFINFEFKGDEEPDFNFNFDQPAYGFVYTRPHFMATVAYGTQSPDDEGRQDLSLIDVSLTTWGEFRLKGQDAGPTRFYFPIALYGSYRRVSPGDAAATTLDAFNISVFGLGLGLALDRTIGQTAFFEARANPVVGLATSSLTDAFGTSYLIDADTQLHLAGLFGRFGLSLGYTFRYQVWNINTSDLFPDEIDDLFDYKGLQHLLRVGVNW